MMAEIKESMNKSLKEQDESRKDDIIKVEKRGDKQFNDLKSMMEDAQKQNSDKIDSLQVNTINHFFFFIYEEIIFPSPKG